MVTMARRAFVFDLDGTIWDSRPWYADILVAAGVPDAAESLSEGTSVATLMRHAGLQSRFAATCKSRHEALAVFSEVIDVIDSLRDSGHAVGAVTNLPSWMAAPMLSAAGLASRFTRVHPWSRGGKSHHLSSLRDEFGTCEQWWYVGDEVADAVAATRAGYNFAWASWGYGEAPETAAAILGQPKDILVL